jgi:hypothetical protein
MKNTANCFIVTILTAIIGFGLSSLFLTGCDNGTTPSHTHEWGEWAVTKAATCSAEGEETRVCSLDATHTETRAAAINTDAHIWGEWGTEIEPACEATGKGSRVCTLNAEHTDTDKVIPAIGHDYGNWTQTAAPTCTEEGEETRSCSHDPTHTAKRPITALGHDFQPTANIATPPTCEEDGAGELACSRCEHTETGGVIDKLGHNYPEWTAPTCTAAGNSTRICTRPNCGHEDTRTTGYAALGHSFVNYISNNDATCEADGTETAQCTRFDVCGHDDTRTTVNSALGHDHVESLICNRAGCNHQYAIGDTGPGGGIIFYVDTTGFTITDTNELCHYLVAAPEDMAEGLAWGPFSYTNAIEGTEWGIGTGRKNTALILAWHTDTPAAKACDEYENNNKTDWFLPSYNELNLLYTNKNYVDNLYDDWYWVSTFSYGGWRINFIDGSYGNISMHATMNRVRPVRAF